MPKLLFKFDAIVDKKIVYRKGQVYDISNESGSADRWIKRGAQIIEESPEKEVEATHETSEDSEEVVNEGPKKENKKEKKSNK